MHGSSIGGRGRGRPNPRGSNQGYVPPPGNRGRGRGLASSGGVSSNGPPARARSRAPPSTLFDQFCIVVVDGGVAELQPDSPTVRAFVDRFVAEYNRTASSADKLAVTPMFDVRRTEFEDVQNELKTRMALGGKPGVCFLFASGDNAKVYKEQIKTRYHSVFVMAVGERDLHQPSVDGIVGVFRNIRNSRNTNKASNGNHKPANDGGGQRKAYPMSWPNVHQLCDDLDAQNLEPGSIDLIQRLSSGSFHERLLNTTTAQADDLSALVHLVAAACPCTATEVRQWTLQILTDVHSSELLRPAYDKCLWTMRCGAVSDKERKQACRTAVDLAVIASALIDRLPTSQDSHKVFSLAIDLQRCDEFGPEFDEAKNKLKVQMNASKAIEERKKNVGKTTDVRPPPQDFRQLSIFPTSDDILAVLPPYLRKNKTDGAYDNSEHYLDVQFRLLREDYLHDMREGIKRLSDYKKDDKHKLLVYHEARISKPYVDDKCGDIVHPVDFKQKSRMRWHQRLIYGSLVCLSNDGFQQNLIFATVFDRIVSTLKEEGRKSRRKKEIKSLEDGHVDLKFENPLAIEYNSEYQMIESPAYFEAYKHVLQGLQDVPRGEEVPFHRYLIQNRTDAVQPPKYIQLQPLVDFSPLLIRKLDGRQEPVKKSVFQLDAHYSARSFGMDPSQFTALKTVLTNEVAVIQGPPGTGKTWVGYQIVKLLLANESAWNRPRAPDEETEGLGPLDRGVERQQHSSPSRPMLVVCYTNHALDQFLEGIADITTGIVRVGGRSKSEKLEPFLLQNVRERGEMPKELQHRRSQMMTKRRNLECRLEASVTASKSLDDNLPRYHSVEPHIAVDEHKAQIEERFTDWLTKTAVDVFSSRLFKPDIVRQLMYTCDIDEMNSRLIAYNSGNESVEHAIAYLQEMARQANRADPLTALTLLPRCRQVEQLPLIASIDALMKRTGCSEHNAVVALIEADNDVQVAMQMIADEFGGAMPNAVVMASAVAMADVEQTDAAQPDVRNNLDQYIVAEDVENERNLDDVGGWQLDGFGGGNGRPMNDNGWATVGRFGRINRDEAFTSQLTRRILRAEPMTDDEERTTVDIWGLPLYRRWQLFALWLKRYKETLEEEYRKCEREYIELLVKLNEIHSMADFHILKQAKVIGMTTTGAAKLQATLRSLKSPIVIVEEAAELFEAHIVTSVTQACEHLILIGDHKQLRPKPSVYQLAKKYNLDVSLFERLVNNGFPYAQLKLQHRMRSQIRQALMPHFYAELEDDVSVSKYPNVKGVDGNLFFLNHSSPEEYAFVNATSPRNEFEASFIVSFVWYLLQQEVPPTKITVLCCYFEQMLTIRKMVDDKVGHAPAPAFTPIHALMREVSVTIVDNYQGEENDIIVLSLVRSNNDGKIGFISIANRMCVALSRARHGLYVFGNFDHLNKSSTARADSAVDGRTNWPAIIASAKEGGFLVDKLPIVCQWHGKPQQIASSTDFAKLSPEGGCLEVCTVRLDCGHPCEKPCHAYSHDKVNCMKPCVRVCHDEELKHPCRKLCHEDCGKCCVQVDRTLECGHSQRERCSKPMCLIRCESPCEENLPCGHKCKNKCGALFCTPACKELVTKSLPCGHTADTPCSVPPAEGRCLEKVTKLWRVCGHQVEVECHVDPEKTPCPSPCATHLPDTSCAHLCKGSCGACFAGRLHIRCSERCQRILVCGHACGSDCSQNCPPCEQRCENACAHSICGSTLVGPNQRNRNCGDPCPECVQPCATNCIHRQCELKCGEICEVGLCDAPCLKLLRCGHPCVGICGEVCPTTKVQDGRRQITVEYCRQCVECEQKCGVCQSCRSAVAFRQLTDSDNMLFGYEDEEWAMFVQLHDCKHVLESSGLDKWIKTSPEVKATDTAESEEDGATTRENGKVKVPECPKCKTPIRRSVRYARYLIASIKLIEKVKEKVRGGGPMALDGQRNTLKAKLENLLPKEDSIERFGCTFPRFVPRGQKPTPVVYDAVEELISKLLQKVSSCDRKQLTLEKLTTWKNVLQILIKLKTSHAEYKRVVMTNDDIEPDSGLDRPHICEASVHLTPEGQPFCARRLLTNEWEKLMVWLRNSDLAGALSNLMVRQLAAELCRLRHLTKFCSWISGLMRKSLDVKTTADLAAVWTLFFGSESIEETVQDQLLAAIHCCVSGVSGHSVYLTKTERIEIAQAIKLARGHWYTCRNGHVYAIGNCGDAVVQAKCPECGTAVGGGRHQLLATNRRADNLMFEDTD